MTLYRVLTGLNNSFFWKNRFFRVKNKTISFLAFWKNNGLRQLVASQPLCTIIPHNTAKRSSRWRDRVTIIEYISAKHCSGMDICTEYALYKHCLYFAFGWTPRLWRQDFLKQKRTKNTLRFCSRGPDRDAVLGRVFDSFLWKVSKTISFF